MLLRASNHGQIKPCLTLLSHQLNRICLKRCEKVRKDIILDSQNRHVVCRACNLGSYSSIKEFVAKLKEGTFLQLKQDSAHADEAISNVRRRPPFGRFSCRRAEDRHSCQQRRRHGLREVRHQRRNGDALWRELPWPFCPGRVAAGQTKGTLSERARLDHRLWM